MSSIASAGTLSFLSFADVVREGLFTKSFAFMSSGVECRATLDSDPSGSDKVFVLIPQDLLKTLILY